ncbi:MAG: diphthine--ammonia ligase [Nanoarchaeota archaeon]|nr:diphthine--ammonia ligase [Nanoarchaeota archaeon]
MKLAVLYSGGKDSNYALYLAQQHGHEVSCLVSMKSENKESYMFQTPGNDFVSLQAECLDIPLIHFETSGEKESEVEDMKAALRQAKEEYGIEGVVSGAIKSAYQGQRVQRVCFELDLECYNPLWQIDEEEFMRSLILKKFDVMILGVFSYPLNKTWVGQKINDEILNKLSYYNKKYSLSNAFEGGEAETFVLDGPNFIKKINIEDMEIIEESENAVLMNIKKARIISK